jgi:hypothetical protein
MLVFAAALLAACGARIAFAQQLPADLPGVDGGAGTVGVTDYRGDFTVASLAQARRILQDIAAGTRTAQVYEEKYARTDVADPDTNDTGGPIVLDTPFPFPSNGPGDDDYIISIAKGTVQVPETGTYTIQVRSDDGFAFRMVGSEFTSATGAGRIDTRDRSIIYMATPTGDSNTRGVANLTAGPHDFEFLMYEQLSGAYWEITSAQGAHSGARTAHWLPFGDSSVVSATRNAPPVTLTGPLTVANLDDITDLTLEFAREEILAAFSSGTVSAQANDITTFIIDDNNKAAGGCPFGQYPEFWDRNTVAQWPNTSGDKNMFSSLIRGSFTVDDGDATAGETLTISFHIDSDDRSLFHILGQDFLGVDAQLTFDIDGDESMFADVDACNTNYTGVIDLKEGVTYDFEAVHVENGGDAGMQVLVALGDFVNEGIDASKFFPLSSVYDPIVAGNKGFALVEKSAGVVGDYNNNGQLDAGDLDLQADAIVGNQNPKPFDLNNDNLVNYGDRQGWVKNLKGTAIGDANLDGKFGTGDLVAIFVAGKYETGTDATWEQGDFDGDKRFGTGDLVAAFADGGFDPNAAVNTVPEPSGIVLTLFGLIGLLSLTRRPAG